MRFRDTTLIQQNTVQIVNKNGSGTGVLLDRTGKVGTAAHVVKNTRTGYLLFLGSTELVVRYEVLAQGDIEENDVAILQTRPNLYIELRQAFGTKYDTPVFKTQRSELQPGEVLAISGYPAIPPRNEIKEAPLLTLGVIAHVQHPKGRALISATVYPGNSGGPCFTEKGEVAGLVVESLLLGKTSRKSKKRKPIKIPTVYSNIFPMSTLRVLANKNGIKLRWRRAMDQ